MLQLLTQTLSSRYFPTSQFGNDFSNPAYNELQKLFEDIASEIESLLPEGKYSVSTNLGRGGIAFVPWIGIHSTNQSFDSSANNGFYLTLLWKYSGSGIALSLQKGTDGITGGNKAGKIQTAVDLIRSKYGTGGFHTSINLEYDRGRPKAYEQAHIFGREYMQSNLNNLENDLFKIEQLYDGVVNDNPIVFSDDEGVPSGIISEQSYEPTFDRDLLDIRAKELLSKPNRKPAKGNQSPSTRVIETTQYERDPTVKADVLERASGVCELCKKKAPFTKDDGTLFLEVHHVIPLAEKGPDTVNNAVALCPNCHREAHLGQNRDRIRQDLQNLIFKS